MPGVVGTPGSPITVPLTAVTAGSLTSPGAVTGPFNGRLSPGPAPVTTTVPTVPAGPTVPTTSAADAEHNGARNGTDHAIVGHNQHSGFARQRRGAPPAGPGGAGYIVGAGAAQFDGGGRLLDGPHHS